MKNRRLTIFCVAVIAIAGAPRVWQEAGKLLALVQHKAQVKFWSMVLQPKTRESAGTALVASAQPFETSQATLNSVCPLHDVESRGTQVWSNSKQTRKADSASAESKAGAQRSTAAVMPLSHAGLIAKALKAPRGDSGAESLRHSRNAFEIQPSEIAESRAEALARHSAASPYPQAIKADTFRFVMLPAMSPVASSLTEKETVMKFKLLKKTSEEPKVIRQKIRIPVSRGISASFF
jgi:hypothetical protein